MRNATLRIFLLIAVIFSTVSILPLTHSYATYVLDDFDGLETGGLEEAEGTTNSPTNSGVCTARSGNYFLRMGDDASADSYDFPANGASNSMLFGIAVRFADTTPASDIDFIKLFNGLATPENTVRFRLKTSGNVDIIDVNNSSVGTITTPFTNGTWHFLETEIPVFNGTASLNMYIDDVSAISLTSKDFLGTSGGGQGVLNFVRATGSVTTGETICFDDYYSLGSASSISDRLTSSFYIPRTFQNTDEDATDLGNTLDSGTWANAGETPINDTNHAVYSTSNVTGGTTTDSPSTRLGLTGSDITFSSIKGAKFLHRLKRGGGGGTTHYKRYGNSGDGMTDTSISLTTSFVNYTTISTSTSVVPTSSESFQYGMKTDGAQDIDAAEIWAFIADVSSPVPTRTPNAKDRAFILMNLEGIKEDE